MLPGALYFRALYVDKDMIHNALAAATDPALAQALQTLDANCVFIDAKSIRTDLIRFFTEFIADVEQGIHTDPQRCAQQRVTEEFIQRFFCYVQLDRQLFRVSLKLMFALIKDRPGDHSNFNIKGDIRLIPKDSENFDALIRYLDSDHIVLISCWTVALFTRLNVGIFVLNFFNIAGVNRFTPLIYGPRSGTDLYMLELLHGVILNFLAPMVIYWDNALNADQYQMYGYQTYNDLDENSDNAYRARSEAITLANRNFITSQYYLSTVRLAGLKNQFVHTVCGEPAEVISRDDVPANYCCIG